MQTEDCVKWGPPDKAANLGILPDKSLDFGQTLDPSMNPSDSAEQFPCLQVTAQSVCQCRALGFVHKQEEPRPGGSPQDTQDGCLKPLCASLSLRPSVFCCFPGILRPDRIGPLLAERVSGHREHGTACFCTSQGRGRTRPGCGCLAPGCLAPRCLA